MVCTGIVHPMVVLCVVFHTMNKDWTFPTCYCNSCYNMVNNINKLNLIFKCQIIFLMPFLTIINSFLTDDPLGIT